MGGRVDAPGEPRDDHDARRRELPPEGERDRRAVRRAGTRADHGHARPLEQVESGSTAHEEPRWRIVDGAKPRREGGELRPTKR